MAVKLEETQRPEAAPVLPATSGAIDEIEWTPEFQAYTDVFLFEGAVLEVLAHLFDDKVIAHRLADEDVAARALPLGHRIVSVRFKVPKWTTMQGGTLKVFPATSLQAIEAKLCWLESDVLVITRALLSDAAMCRHLSAVGLLDKVGTLNAAVLLRRARAQGVALEVLRAVTAPPFEAGKA